MWYVVSCVTAPPVVFQHISSDETRCHSLELKEFVFSNFGWFIWPRILHWRRGTDKNMALNGKIEEYNENDSWIEYTERLENYFAANEIPDNNKKRALLLSVCGAKTNKLIRNLVNPRKPTDKSFTEIVKLVKNHLNPRPSSIVYRLNLKTVSASREKQYSNMSPN